MWGMDGSRELPQAPHQQRTYPKMFLSFKKTAISFLPRLDMAVFLLIWPPAKNFKEDRKFGQNSSLCDILGIDKYK